jgi:hypothetical protein
MVGNGGAAGGFVAATAMLPGGSVFAPASANVGAPPTTALPIDAATTATTTRPAMRWTTNSSSFVLRRMSQLIESGARDDKSFKEKEVNQVAKHLREYSGEEVTFT